MNTTLNRRTFIKSSTLVLSVTKLLATDLQAYQDKKAWIRFIQVGRQGRNHVRNILLFLDAAITAIGDIDPKAIAATQLAL